MAGAQGDPKKWNMPGWRIEQRYSTNVLIGNWQEERLKVINYFAKRQSASLKLLRKPLLNLALKASSASGSGRGRPLLLRCHACEHHYL